MVPQTQHRLWSDKKCLKKKSRSTDEGGTDGVRDGEREKLSAEGKRERERESDGAGTTETLAACSLMAWPGSVLCLFLCYF